MVSGFSVHRRALPPRDLLVEGKLSTTLTFSMRAPLSWSFWAKLARSMECDGPAGMRKGGNEVDVR